MIADIEISRRAPVWQAMSNLFLDTELDEGDCLAIAAAIIRAGFSRDEAELIFRSEVLPVFAPNLFSVAGDWQGWRENDVRNLIVEAMHANRAGANVNFTRRWWRLLMF